MRNCHVALFNITIVVPWRCADIRSDVRDAPNARLYSKLLSKRKFTMHSISKRFLFRGSEREAKADRYTRPSSERYVLYLLRVLMHSFVLHLYACSVAYRVWPIVFCIGKLEKEEIYRNVPKTTRDWKRERVREKERGGRKEGKTKLEILLAYIMMIEF